jgi:uncharacterized membrane protein
MPTLDSEIRVAAPRAIVFEVARDVESFPSYMPDVESVEVIERDGDGSPTLTRWVGLVPEFRQKIRWTEEDVWDESAFTCDFHQTQGDYQKYEGQWRFDDDAGATLFRSTLTYELEIPLIGALLTRIIAKKMRDNMDKILAAIKTRAEGRSKP